MELGFSALFRRSAVLLLMAGCCNVNGFPSGAPDSTCSTMLPNHVGFTAQTSPAPYQITTSSSTYSPEQNITVTISATVDGSEFTGFLVRTENSVGTFSASSADSRTACSSSGVTHANGALKSSLSFTWTAPASQGTGAIIFVATVVQSFETFWTHIKSVEIIESPGGTESERSLITTTAETAMNFPVDDIDTSGCDTIKACFRVPKDCTINCDYVLTWTNVDQAVNFEMSASVSSNNYWVSFGLSHDQKMGDDSVIDCVFNEQTGTVVIQASIDVGHDNEILSNPKLGLVPGTMSGSINNGRITCRFQRLRSITQTSNKRRRSATRHTALDAVFSLDANEYYLLMAKGEASGGVKQYHQNNRVFSSSNINMTESTSVDIGDDSLKRAFVKIHGCLMLIAWMVFASSGILMARYYKLAWPDTTWYGKKIWFQIHQMGMIITALLTAASFVVVFVAVCGYSQLSSPTVAHPPLGIVVMALVIINPIMATFRPGPTAERRPIFNVFHFLVGTIAHLSSVVTMFLGLYMAQLSLPTWCRFVMIIYICIHAAAELVLAIHMHANKCCPSDNNASEGVEMKTYGSSQTAVPSSESATVDLSSKLKTVVLAVHLSGVTACCAAIVVQIGLS